MIRRVRRRPVQPWRLVASHREQLVQLAVHLEALAERDVDGRGAQWLAASEACWRAASELSATSAPAGTARPPAASSAG